MANRAIIHGTRSSNLADVLERVLDKGLVIAGDIKIKLVEIELLTIQLRLVVCSVDRAIELGIDWWRHDPNLAVDSPDAAKKVGDNQPSTTVDVQIQSLEQQIARLRADVLERSAKDKTLDPS